MSETNTPPLETVTFSSRPSFRTNLLKLVPIIAWSIGWWLIGAGRQTWQNLLVCLGLVVIMHLVADASAHADQQTAVQKAIRWIAEAKKRRILGEEK